MAYKCPTAYQLWAIQSSNNQKLIPSSFVLCINDLGEIIIPPPNEVGGGVYWIHLVRPSVRLSVCL